MDVILIGYRGSGKTTVGAELAKRLGKPLVDLDAVIVQAMGMPISEAFARHGEAWFRDHETRSLQRVLEGPGGILATGGGVVTREANRAMLLPWRRRVIYLRCGAAELARRMAIDPATAGQRPTLTGTDPVSEVAKVLAEREPWYAACAGATLEAETLKPAQIAETITKLLGQPD